MNNFEIFKLKKLHVPNHRIQKIAEHYLEHGQSMTANQMAKIGEIPNSYYFNERYHRLDLEKLREEFNRFPSISILDDIFPQALKEIYDTPVQLFYQGNLDLLSLPKMAVVGSRDASDSGIQSVRKIIRELNNQFVIVSGLARGIDTAAHLASLKNGGKTIAVIGCGLDQYYPPENKALQDYIAKNHLLITEYPPGSKPFKFHFPARNRIIAGLSQGVIVAEAKMRSGSLITCERAMEEGREVFAIPGSILDGKSDGCHHLIQEGAKCVTSGFDVLSEFSY